MPRRDISVWIPAGIPTPTLERTLSGPVADVVVTAWRSLIGEHVDTGQYAASLSSPDAIQYPYVADRDQVAVVSTVPQAYWLEYGRAGFHLASRWGSRGGRWLVSKAGKLFARVPFRVPTPVDAKGGASSHRRRLGTAMPRAVYSEAKKLEDYRATKQRLHGFGDMYKQAKSYGYYAQAFGGLPATLAGAPGYEWKASQFENMFRTTMPTPGGGRHTEYMTIRTITPDSKGWFIPPTPAYHFAERALEAAAVPVTEMIEAAVAEDIDAAIASVAGELLQ
jgi:hypothetical protein